jgi:NAD(P)-dependent dehydrogenase (short-subunit alcohol dehydrogenase family)
VFLCARSQADVDATVSRLSDRGFRVFGAALDVTDAAQRQALVAQASQAFGGQLNILGARCVMCGASAVLQP